MSGFLSGKDEKNRQKILEGTFRTFREKGSDFTMNDLSKELGMSKKTIYTVFRDKEDLFMNLVDYFFDGVKAGEVDVVNDTTLSTKEKFTRILGVMPASSSDIDFSSVYVLKNKYPKVYHHLRERLESGWEMTFRILEDGEKEGVFRHVEKEIFQITFEAAIERFLSSEELKKAHIRYGQALNELVSIMVGGILA